MAETVLAGKQVEELAAEDRAGTFALAAAEIARLAKHFLVRDRPGDAGDGESQQEEPCHLLRKRHGNWKRTRVGLFAWRRAGFPN